MIQSIYDYKFIIIIKQKDTLDYITEERTFMQSEEVKNTSLEALGLLWFLRLRMAENTGWGYKLNKNEFSKLTYELSIDLNMKQRDIQLLCRELIDKGVIKIVNGKDGYTYWTTLQQFYNYEYKNWTRIKNN